MTAIILLGNALLHILPNLTRPGLFFAVTVDPAFRRSSEARAILAAYRVILWSSGAAAIGLLFATGFTLAALLLWFAGFVCALAVAHHRTLPHAASPGPVPDAGRPALRETLPGGVLLLLAPTASVIVLGIWVTTHWINLPQQLPVHWGVRGADRWVAVSLRSVYAFLVVHATLTFLMAVCAWGVLRWSRPIFASGPAAAGERRFRRNISLMLLVIACFLAAQAWIAILEPTTFAMEILGAALAVVTIVFLAVLIRSGQGGRAGDTDHTPDACWKWGLFYFNPADPSLFVEKRFGIGYTINFGNRWSWALSVLLILPLLLMRILLR